MATGRGWILAGGIAIGLGSAVDVAAQSHFPRVYGPTGHTYGPTQAHYQYARQYGQPWHGQGGFVGSGQPAQHHVTVAAPYFPPGYWGGYASSGYVPVYGYGGAGYGFFAGTVVPVPVWGYAGPGYYGAFGLYGTPGFSVPYPDYALARQPWTMTEPLQDAMRENAERWGENLPDVPPDPVVRPVAPSSTAARLKGIEAQTRADAAIRRQEWLQAYRHLKTSIDAAPDRPESHLRLGLVLVAMQQFESGITSLKRAAVLDPSLGTSIPSMVDIFGPDSDAVQNSLAHKVIEYVQRDVRDPDRLFLLGVVLRMQNDPRSREVLETGLRLAGRGQHFAALLKPATIIPTSAPVNVPQPNPAIPPRTLPAPPEPSLTDPASERVRPQRPAEGLPPAPVPLDRPAPSSVPQPAPVFQLPALPSPAAPTAPQKSPVQDPAVQPTSAIDDGPTLLPPAP